MLDGLDRDAALKQLDEIFGPDGEDARSAMLNGLELMNAQFNAHGVELGQRYTSTAVVGDGTEFPPYTRDPELHYHPTTHPGAALPHAWLGRGTHDISTLDLGGVRPLHADHRGRRRGMGGGGRHGLRGARRRGPPLPSGPRPGRQRRPRHLDPAREVADDGCVLVRPDRFVAWRSAGAVDDPTSALSDVMHTILDRGSHP